MIKIYDWRCCPVCLNNSHMYSSLHSNIASVGCLCQAFFFPAASSRGANTFYFAIFRPLGLHQELMNITMMSIAQGFSHQHIIQNRDSCRSPIETHEFSWGISRPSCPSIGPTLHRTGWNLAPEHRWPHNVVENKPWRIKGTRRSELWLIDVNSLVLIFV